MLRGAASCGACTTTRRHYVFRLNSNIRCRMKITVHRQACCSQDDQIGELEAEFSIAPDATFSSLVQEIVKSGFLQFSSTHNRKTGEIEGKGLVEVFSPYSVNPKPPEFKVNPSTSVVELLGENVLSFRFLYI